MDEEWSKISFSHDNEDDETSYLLQKTHLIPNDQLNLNEIQNKMKIVNWVMNQLNTVQQIE